MTEQPRGDADSVAFSVAGTRLVGVLYRAPGKGPHPAAVLLHGIPGAEKNHDIAYALREAGWHAFIIHFRGAWGSDGAYDIPGQVDDAVGALDWLLRPDNPFAVDATRLALVGFSLGSRAALLAAARDERVAAVVSIAGIADFTGPGLGEEFLAESATILNGVSGPDIGQQWTSLAGEEQPTQAVARLKMPLLIVHGWDDEVVPVFHADQLAMHAGPDSVASKVLVDGANHVFSAHRGEVVREVLGWLTATLPG